MKPEQLEFWIDLNLPPSLAIWLREIADVQAKTFYQLGFQFTSDIEVFRTAQTRSDIIVITTKDIDFLQFQEQSTQPPKILYINTGNVSNRKLKAIIIKIFPEILIIFTRTNQTLIEITN